MADRSLYEVLGVPEDASSDDIKVAYKRLLRTVHPDVGGNAALFEFVQAAYVALSDPARRAAYDRSRSGASQPPRASHPPPTSNQARRPTAPSTPPAAQSRTGLGVFAALGLLGVLGAGTAVGIALAASSEQDTAASGTSSSSAAAPARVPRPSNSQTNQPVEVEPGLLLNEKAIVAERARTLFSYDYRALDDAVAAVQGISEGAAEAEYVQTFNEVVRAVAMEHRATVAAEALEVGVLSRSGAERTFLVFLNQTTTSTRVAEPQVDRSRLLLTLNAADLVTSFEVVDASSPTAGASGDLGALRQEVAQALRPLFDIDAEDFDADLDRVLDSATGPYAADFKARSSELEKVLRENEVRSDIALEPVVAIVSSGDNVITAIAVVDTDVTNKTTPEGRTNTYRVSCTLTRVDGNLLVEQFEFVS